MNTKLLSALILALLSDVARPYEQSTHALLTRASVARSMLQATNQGLMRDLDLTDPRALDPKGSYFEVINPFAGVGGAAKRTWQSYENDILGILGVAVDSTAPGNWIVRGAVREDDNPAEDPPTPQDVSPGLKRPLHHFFDPFNNRPLSGGGVGAIDGDIHRNPDWAIGSADSFLRPNTPEMGRRNHFSVFDAREAMFRALTLKWRDSDGSFKDLMLTGVDAMTREIWRKAYWATTFRALGDAVHLIQDMAQPQHTRNEAHSGMLCWGAIACLGGHTSVYEKYVDARARGRSAFLSSAPFRATVQIPTSPLDTGAYEIPTFLNYTDYWSTAPGPASIDGQGLADYSNRGFFTAKYNLGTTEYGAPPGWSGAYSIEARAPQRWDGTTIPDGAPVYVYKGSVPDKVRSLATPDVALTSYGVWDQFMQAQGTQPSYSLNRVNYDAMADLLIPRAVAYSAGFIDYFFRGRLAIAPPAAGFYAVVDHARFAPGTPDSPTDALGGFRGFDALRLRLTNATADITPPLGAPTPQPMSGGHLHAVVKFNRNRCYDDLLANWPADRLAAQGCRGVTQEIVVSDPLSASVPFASAARPEGDEYTFRFPNQQIPINAWNVVLQVVYRGKLGKEDDAVVVATKDLSEPTFVSFLNVTDHVLLDGKFHTPSQLRANQALFGSVRSECRIGTPGSYEVWQGCYDLGDNFVFHATGDGGVALSTTTTPILPRRFGRVALLADAVVRPRFAFDANLVNCWMFLANPFELAPYTSQLDPQGGGSYSPPDSIRDVPSWDTVTCYSDIGIALTAPGAFDLHDLDPLQAEEKVPIPMTISGW
jgi:hypothetical protein